MAHPLTEGALLTMCQGGHIENPVLQVISYKRIAGSAVDRYRLMVSDGMYSNCYAMLNTQENSKISDGTLTEQSVVRVTRFLCNNMQGKKVIIVGELEVLQSGNEVGGKIGNPISMNSDGTVTNENPNKPAASHVAKRAGDNEVAQPPPKRPLQAANKSVSRLLDPSESMPLSSQSSGGSVQPIKSLNPYMNRWTIKARVTQKSDIRTWSNSKGEGCLFSMDLMDESGEIRCTGFKEQCDKFHKMLEVGKVYLISNCTLKPANKQYSKLDNDYEMTMKESTEVFLCTDDDAAEVPSIVFNFVKISDLSAELKDQTVDLIGVCKSASDVQTITSQKLNKELQKRDVTLVDKSLSEINLTLWGPTAVNFDPTGNPVVAIKGAKVSDYNGVSLSTLGSTTIQINPDLDRSHELKGWYEEEGATMAFNSLTQSGPRGGGGADFSAGAKVMTFAEAKSENIGMSDKVEYFSATATVSTFRKENALYQACANEKDGKTCNKKVQDQNNGMYRCERCGIESDKFNWRLILSLSVVDVTDNQWVQCFQEQGEQLLGLSAETLGDYFVSDKAAYDKAFEAATFKKYNFRFRCKADNYNDQTRSRSTIVSASEINWPEYIRRLAQELKAAGENIPAKIADRYL